MTSLARIVFPAFLSMVFVIVLASGAAAKQGAGKGEGVDAADRAHSAEQVREWKMHDQAGKEARDEKAPEQVEKARDRSDISDEGTPAEGLEKQREKKVEQGRAEEGKGSEQGQKMREEHSRKWWKFWE